MKRQQIFWMRILNLKCPINAYESKSAFMQAVKFTGDNATNIHMLTELGNENEVILIYEFDFAPIGNMRIAEHFKINSWKNCFYKTHSRYFSS
ncbi:MAG: hypothetical protein HC905_13105 [Bacteroidales bacterium]|nr:hypothetical protein [Bacteroidales bacterium]